MPTKGVRCCSWIASRSGIPSSCMGSRCRSGLRIHGTARSRFPAPWPRSCPGSRRRTWRLCNSYAAPRRAFLPRATRSTRSFRRSSRRGNRASRTPRTLWVVVVRHGYGVWRLALSRVEATVLERLFHGRATGQFGTHSNALCDSAADRHSCALLESNWLVRVGHSERSGVQQHHPNRSSAGRNAWDVKPMLNSTLRELISTYEWRLPPTRSRSRMLGRGVRAKFAFAIGRLFP